MHGIKLWQPGGKARDTWYFDWVDPGTGTRVRKSTGTANKAEAHRVAEAKVQELQRATANQDGPRYTPTSMAYLASITKKETAAAWRNCMRRWDEFEHDGVRLRDLYLSEITADYVAAYIDKRKRAKVSDASIRLELGYLSGLFSWAGIDWQDNPVKTCKAKRKLKKAKMVDRFATPEEEQRLLACARHDIHERMIIFAIETGLRVTEQKTLRWGDVDLTKREATIVQARSKNMRARVVPLSERAIEQIADRYDPDPAAPVFTNKFGEAFSKPYAFWNLICERAGIDDLRWHDLRHTFASRWLQDGGQLVLLSKILGHSNIQMTMRYAHLATDTLHLEMARLDRLRADRRTEG